MAAKDKHRNSRVRNTPAYVVEIEYKPLADVGGRLPGKHAFLLERSEGMVGILAEGVYAYLKKRGVLARAETGQNLPGMAPHTEGKIPDE